MELQYSFGKYLCDLRKSKHISLETLSDGLCDAAMISRFEQDEREPGVLLQERLLSRLGVEIENHENFLMEPEYEKAKLRMQVVDAIVEGQLSEGEAILEQYKGILKDRNNLEEQFYWVMYAQIRRQSGAKEVELADFFSKALELTVPDYKTGGFENRLLSLEEQYLLVESLYYEGGQPDFELYDRVLNYIEGQQKTSLSFSKLFPQAVYYYFLKWEAYGKKNKTWIEKIGNLCVKAIELLRDTERMFFFYELLGAKLYILEKYYEETEEKYKKWRQVIEEIYIEHGVRPEMKHCCHIFIGAENYRFGDVVRIRRKMFGLTMEELAEGICGTRTISRLERNNIHTQRYTAEKILEKLNLRSESYHIEIVTNRHKDRVRYCELTKRINEHDFEKAEALLEELKTNLDMTISFNRQAIGRQEMALNYYTKRIEKEEYKKGIRMCLEETLSLSDLDSKMEVFFSNTELMGLRNLAAVTEREERQEYNKMLENIVHSGICQYCQGITEYLWSWIASELGNAEDYDDSDIIEKELVWKGLIYRRIFIVHASKYSQVWNDEQRRKKGRAKYSIDECKAILQQCIHLSELGKNQLRFKHYMKKMETEY